MNKYTLLTIVGLAIGGIGTLIGDFVSDKKMEDMIDEKIEKKLNANNSSKDKQIETE